VDWFCCGGAYNRCVFTPDFKVWKNKSAKDLSLSMYVAMLLGITLWLIYGISIDSPSMIAANSVTLVLVISILYFKLKFK
jgi:MtN3 and saliva related transmembrane protein